MQDSKGKIMENDEYSLKVERNEDEDNDEEFLEWIELTSLVTGTDYRNSSWSLERNHDFQIVKTKVFNGELKPSDYGTFKLLDSYYGMSKKD